MSYSRDMKFTRPLAFAAVVLVSSTAALPVRDMFEIDIRNTDPSVFMGRAISETGLLMERGFFSKIAGFAKGLFGFKRELNPSDDLHARFFIDDPEKIYTRSLDEEQDFYIRSYADEANFYTARSYFDDGLDTRSYADDGTGLVERGLFSKIAGFAKGLFGFKREVPLEVRSEADGLVERGIFSKIAGFAKGLFGFKREVPLEVRSEADGLVERGIFSKIAGFAKGLFGFKREVPLEVRSEADGLVERGLFSKIAGFAKGLFGFKKREEEDLSARVVEEDLSARMEEPEALFERFDEELVERSEDVDDILYARDFEFEY
ncbi:hypothetical protein C0991_007009 [Blastosporella zonata]|nr:hypothetical protein C0991_007009 [Blastosporella zonata]